jgi:hypothetical protein
MESNDTRHEMAPHIPLALKIEAAILGAAVGDALGWSAKQNRVTQGSVHFMGAQGGWPILGA